jgi:hypothetical protein
VQRRVVLERLSYGKEGVVAGVLWNVGETGRDVMRGDLLAEPRDRSVVRAEQAREAEKQGRLPCPWLAHNADNFSSADVETDITECRR